MTVLWQDIVNTRAITKNIKQRGISNNPILEIQWNPRCFQRDLTEVKKLKTLTSHRKINDELNETGIYHQALKLIIYNPGLLKSM